RPAGSAGPDRDRALTRHVAIDDQIAIALRHETEGGAGGRVPHPVRPDQAAMIVDAQFALAGQQRLMLPSETRRESISALQLLEASVAKPRRVLSLAQRMVFSDLSTGLVVII